MVDDAKFRRIWLSRALLVSAAAYGTYRIYSSEQVRYIIKVTKCFVKSGWKISEALSVAAELSTKALTDLKEFLDAEEDEMPASLVQLCKILSSKEVGQATSSIMSAVVDGVGRAGLEDDSVVYNMGVVDRLLIRVIDGFLSEKGKTLVSLAISVATRNAVKSMCTSLMHPEIVGRGGALISTPNDFGGDRVIRSFATDVLNAASSDQGKCIMEVGISAFARSFVEACQESFSGANIADGFFSAIAKPGNVEAIKGIAGTASREAVSSLVSSTTTWFMDTAGAHSPTSVSVNNFEMEGCPSVLQEPHSCKADDSENNQPLAIDTPRVLPLKSNRIGAQAECSNVSRVFDPLTDALISFCRVPEARQLIASVAGSVAKESTKGVVMSLPELTVSFWSMATSAGMQCVQATHFAQCDNSTWMVILLCTLMHLCSNLLDL